MSNQEQTLPSERDSVPAIARKTYVAFGKALYWVLFIAAFVCCMASVDGELGRWEGCAIGLAWLWVAVFVHEAGHAVAALACGWKVLVFAAGPLGYQFHNREFAIIPRAERAELAGFVLPAPRSVSVWTRYRAALISAGGPIANLVLSAAAAVAAIAWQTDGASDTLNSAMAACGLSLLSAATALNSMTPVSEGKHPSDIENFLRVLRGDGAKWRRTRAIARLYALAKYKVRLRDLPLWMLEESRAESNSDKAMRRGHDALEIGIVLDSLPVDANQARELLDRFRDEHGEDAWLACCDAYFSAVWERDAVRGRAHLWKGQIVGELRPLALASEAAVLAREGNATAAQAKLQQMRKLVARESAFTDLTFRDIGSLIDDVMSGVR